MVSIARYTCRTAITAALLGSAFVVAGDARAQTIPILAVGASNTAGYGVGAGSAWPAVLESMLKAKGCNVSVSVNAVAGEGSGGVLARVAAIPAGTKVVVFDVGAGNDRDAGNAGAIGSNRALIEQRIRAQGAKPVYAAYARIVGAESSNKSAWQANDPHHHLTAQSHARVAAALVPQVMAAIGHCR